MAANPREHVSPHASAESNPVVDVLLQSLVSPERITVETREHLLLIGLNRTAKRNAFDLQMYAELAQAYGSYERDPQLRCAVLYAHGDHFAGGIELPQWAPFFRDGRMPPLPAGAIDPLMREQSLGKPLVIAVQGWCLTIGLELLLAADIRVAADNTRFAQIEIKRGIYPIGGATVRLVQELGWGNAMRILLTGDEFGSEQAYRLGLVQEVAPAGEQLERAIDIATTIARQSPVGVRATLASARLARQDGERVAFARMLIDLQAAMATDDAVEGLNAFLERREPRFKSS
jgi:enoyl-CoA hydratase